MPQNMPIDIPPGFHRNGSEMESRGRWRDGNLIRWEEGSIRPIGGWVPLVRDNGGVTENVTVPAGTGRASWSWISNGGEKFLAVATDDNLYAAGISLILEDITPVGFSPGLPGENLGYGGKKYGQSSYGTGRISTGDQVAQAVWSLDNWGEYLLACTSSDRTLYVWDLITATAEEIVAAPPMEYFVVTAERFVMAFGASNNPRLVAWCDRENYDDWTPTAVNEAGDIELVTTGAIQGGCKVRGRTLILTTIDAHVASYAGPGVVYGFQRIGTGCGLAAPRTLVSASFGAFWMGSSGFFAYDGSEARQLPCDVLDHVFLQTNPEELRKAFGVVNEKSQEIWWFYPSSNSLENDRYVAFDFRENHWLIGTLDRSTGVDAGAYADPIWVRKNGNIYRHEVGWSHSSTKPWIETGPIQLGNGDEVVYATRMLQDQLHPTTINLADLTLDVRTSYFSEGPTYEWGPYPLMARTDVRFSGVQMFMKITATDGATFRLGGVYLEHEKGGRN